MSADAKKPGRVRARRVLVVGNCQAETLRRILQVSLQGMQVQRLDVAQALADGLALPEHDHVFVQDHPRLASLLERHAGRRKVLTYPNISFNGYHADMLGLRPKEGEGGLTVVSNIALWSFVLGLTRDECIALYAPDFIGRLNYARIFDVARRELVRSLDRHGMSGSYWFQRWHLQAPFMMNVGHPRLFVMRDVAEQLCRRAGLSPRPVDLSLVVASQGRRGDMHPPYSPDRALDRSLVSRDCSFLVGMKSLDLPAYVDRTYALLSEQLDRFALPVGRRDVFEAALAAHRPAVAARTPTRVNPYAGGKPTQFWAKSVAEPAASEVAPVASKPGIVHATSKVATAGSCFAQHISKTLVARGMRYFVAEAAPAGMSPETAQERRFGMFSARYGNVYTARQLLQLAQRAYGEFEPAEQAWVARSGRLLDPFRPNIGDEFDTAEALADERETHLSAVRRMLEELDILVFTLGLTEAWERTQDGAVYPVAPGVVSVHEDYTAYRFRNFGHDEILGDMLSFLEILARVNPRARVILTVSPVPLIATYEDQHVLAATTYSKSVLRTVAQTLANAFDHVHYFPSYEIITGPHAQGRYFEPDLRSVRQEGVDHVMRVFVESLVAGAAAPATPAQAEPMADDAEDEDVVRELRSNADIVCDEDLIVSQRR